MTLPYLVRLACLCFASFFAAQLFIGAPVWAASQYSEKIARNFRPAVAARLLFILRLAPLCGGLFVVLALCLPSYLWLEPAATNERVGITFCVAAALGAWLCTRSVIRAAGAAVNSIRFARKCQRAGTELKMAGVSSPATIVDGHNPALAMAGLFRARILISRRLFAELSPEQLEVAVNHELAHRNSRDNFKRLLLMLSPEFAPFKSAFQEIERGWRRVSEWAADDAASGEDPEKAVALAEALLRVVRIGASAQLSPLCSTLLPGRADLAERVERLLNPRQLKPMRVPWKRVIAPTCAVCIAGLTLILSRPMTLHVVHEFMERLIH